MNDQHPLYAKAQVATRLSFGLFAAMIGLIVFWNITRDTGFSFVIFAIQSLPLLAFVPSMLKGVYRGYSWLCFALLFYFIFAVQRVFMSTSQVVDYIFLGLIVCLFITAMMNSRWLQRIQKSHTGEAGAEEAQGSKDS